jgi:hypothetical protein
VQERAQPYLLAVTHPITDSHIQWTNAWSDTIMELEDYVENRQGTGFQWNRTGRDVRSMANCRAFFAGMGPESADRDKSNDEESENSEDGEVDDAADRDESTNNNESNSSQDGEVDDGNDGGAASENKTKKEDNITQVLWEGRNPKDPSKKPEKNIHLTRPVYDKMRRNKNEAKVKRDCQDPTKHIKKKPKRTHLIHDEISGRELDVSPTELNYGDGKDFHRMSAEEMPVLAPKIEFPCDVSPKIVNIACMEGNSLRIIDGCGGFHEPSAISEDVIKQEFQKCPELENVEQIDIKDEFVCDD